MSPPNVTPAKKRRRTSALAGAPQGHSSGSASVALDAQRRRLPFLCLGRELQGKPDSCPGWPHHPKANSTGRRHPRIRFPSMMALRSPESPSFSAYENWGSRPDRLVQWPQPPPKRCEWKDRRTSPLADATSAAPLLAPRTCSHFDKWATARNNMWRATGWGGRPAV